MLFLHFNVEQPKARENTYTEPTFLFFIFLFKNRTKTKTANLKTFNCASTSKIKILTVIYKNKK